MDTILKWPVTKCEACDYDLREVTPKAAERSNVKGRPNWTDFCPECGHGYVVADRVLPTPTAEVLAELEAGPVLSYVKDGALEGKPEGEPSGIPPDKRGEALAAETTPENPDPEGHISQEPSASPEGEPEPGAITPPGEGQFFCTKCAGNHNESSGIGKRHSKHREA